MLPEGSNVVFIAVGGALVLLIALLGIVASYYTRVPPNKVAVVFGKRSRDAEGRGTGFRLVQGGGFMKWPVVTAVEWISLEVMPIPVTTTAAVTIDGVPVRVDALANIKIGSTESLQRAAAERFLTMQANEIHQLVQQTMEGHLRAIVGTMTVEDLIRNRAAFSNNLVEQSAKDLETMGLIIDNMPIRDIQDENGYIDALGKKRIAEVRRDAQIGMAEAQRDADLKSAAARQVGETAKIQADVGIAQAERDKRISVAQFDAQANSERAKADQAGPLASAQALQAVKIEQVKIDENERKANIAVQEQEALRKEQELIATVIRPAEAEKQRLIIDAEAKRQAAIVAAGAEQQAAVLRAQGQRDARIVQAEADQAERERMGLGDGAKARATGEGEAESVRVRGIAEGEAIRARLVAEAEGMREKAAAWREYGDAAVLQMLLERYPAMIAAMSGPMQAIGQGLAAVDRISVVDIGGGDGKEAAVGRLVNQVPQQFLALNEQIKALFGIDMAAMLSEKMHAQQQAPGKAPTPKTHPAPQTPPPAAPEETEQA
jgi:flotillin